MPAIYADKSDRDLLRHLAKVSVSNGKAAMAYAALVDDDWFEAISELRRRYCRTAVEAFDRVQENATDAMGRMRSAESVEIDRGRWNSFFYGRRIALSKIGPMIGRCDGWASVTGSKRHTSLQAIEELAIALDIELDDLLHAVGSDRERVRVGLIK